MDVATYIFNNQYYPRLIDKVYYELRQQTWDYCMNMQKNACSQVTWMGPMTDFKKDPIFNRKMGFPENSYVCFIKEKLCPVIPNKRYILDHFVRGKEVISLKDMMKHKLFKHMFIFHIAEYLFMNLLCSPQLNGTYLIIPADTPEGISSAEMDFIIANYNDPYTTNCWYMEVKNKNSYGFANTIVSKDFTSNRLYLSAFADRASFYKEVPTNVWKVAMSTMTDEPNLLTVTIATLAEDENGEVYLEVSDTFHNFITNQISNIRIFAYNDSMQVGYTISPNYIGPTQYLKTVFDEYFAAIDHRRLKVLTEHGDGGETTLVGQDAAFGNTPTEDLVAVGFTNDECWVSIPTKEGIGPIYPGNFRVWEYDANSDTLGRLLEMEMHAKFPNIYLYKMDSSSHLLYIEWFRNDKQVGLDYNDFIEGYRKYIGPQFPIKLMQGDLADIVSNFEPLHAIYDTRDFVKHILLESMHQYRVEKMVELLKETGMNYAYLYNRLDGENAAFTTITYELAKYPALYQQLISSLNYGEIRIQSLNGEMYNYDLYIDGIRVRDTSSYHTTFAQVIRIPNGQLKADSVIIIDYYDIAQQHSAMIDTSFGTTMATLPANLGMDMISGADIVVSNADGMRIDNSMIQYGVFVYTYLIQVPETLIDWDALGIDINNWQLYNRVGVTTQTGASFKAVTFALPVLKDDPLYAVLKSNEDQRFELDDGKILIVQGGKDYINVSGNVFSKRIKATNISIGIQNYQDPSAIVYNANVYRTATKEGLADGAYVNIDHFYGADDPNRILGFINGMLADTEDVGGTIPDQMGDTFTLHFIGTFNNNDEATAVYLPFPVDRFDVVSDDKSRINLAGSGVMCIGVHDMIFENGKRIPNDKLERVTNQLIKAPTANAVYSIIRIHRDSNLYEFDDVEQQSFMDKLLNQSPGYKQYLGLV